MSDVNVALIPLRAGSKGIPGKNRKGLLGRPLFSWTLLECLRSRLDATYVYSDDDRIRSLIQGDYAWADKVRFMDRPAETACDGASSELALMDFVSRLGHSPGSVCLVQATSPLLCAEDINGVLSALDSGRAQSALSVVRSHRFRWSEGGQALNYSPESRPRRQDWDGELYENGAIYASRLEAIKASRCRISGAVACVEMPQDSLYEIDAPEDWPVVEALLERRLRSQKPNPSYPIKAMVFDVDGCLTDGTALYGPEGEFGKAFSLRDGQGLALLREAGVQVLVLSGEDNPALRHRLSKLGIEHSLLGVGDKLARLWHWCAARGLGLDQLAYLGDDLNDLACLLSVGLSFCPADAVDRAKSCADVPLSQAGGHGAAREAIEYVLRRQAR